MPEDFKELLKQKVELDKKIAEALTKEDKPDVDDEDHDGCACVLADASVTEDEDLPEAEGGIALA
jgi:hypothetical protein